MEFTKALDGALSAGELCAPQDLLKFCYQAAFGGRHILEDPMRAREALIREWERVSPEDEPLCSMLSDSACRISLKAWKKHGLPIAWLWNLFFASASAETEGAEERFLSYLSEATEKQRVFSDRAWREYLDAYFREGIHPVHHSEQSRERFAPAYRVVDPKRAAALPILLWAAKQKADAGRRLVIAIDGRAASGKTTLAKALCEILDAGVVHADDFFLPPELRTEKRLCEAGGNLHRERFAQEVLPNLRIRRDFSYRIFDCGSMEIGGVREVKAGDFCVVEGSYSHHPFFGRYADLAVFSDVSPEEQMRRIVTRNGEKTAQRFREIWIPMEEKYFDAYGIRAQADLVLPLPEQG